MQQSVVFRPDALLTAKVVGLLLNVLYQLSIFIQPFRDVGIAVKLFDVYHVTWNES